MRIRIYRSEIDILWGNDVMFRMGWIVKSTFALFGKRRFVVTYRSNDDGN